MGAVSVINLAVGQWAIPQVADPSSQHGIDAESWRSVVRGHAFALAADRTG
jgi:hypothetical protein